MKSVAQATDSAAQQAHFNKSQEKAEKFSIFDSVIRENRKLTVVKPQTQPLYSQLQLQHDSPWSLIVADATTLITLPQVLQAICWVVGHCVRVSRDADWQRLSGHGRRMRGGCARLGGRLLAQVLRHPRQPREVVARQRVFVLHSVDERLSVRLQEDATCFIANLRKISLIPLLSFLGRRPTSFFRLVSDLSIFS